MPPSTLASNTLEPQQMACSCPVPLAASYASLPTAAETLADDLATQPFHMMVATVPVPAVLLATNFTN